MKSAQSKFILLFIIASLSYQSWAFDDGFKNKSIKKSRIHTQTQPLKLLVNTDQDDTLVYEKHVDDTLIFDDTKTGDDTLIFADDEAQMRGKISQTPTSSTYFLQQANNSEPLNPLLYPNPSFGSSILELNTPEFTLTTIQIRTQDGILLSSHATNSAHFELNGMKAGTYIITIKNELHSTQKRWIVR